MGRKTRKGRNTGKGKSGGGAKTKSGGGKGPIVNNAAGRGSSLRDPNNGGRRQQGPANMLNYLNRPLAYRTLFFLTLEERIQLGKAYPRFQVTRQESSSQQSKPSQTKETKANKQESCMGDKPGTDDQISPNNNLNLNLAIPEDPHTLLARLNTKRLHRRICHLRKQDPTNFDIQQAYAQNKTTEQVAISEWQGLLTDYKTKMMRSQEKKNDSSKATTTTHEEEAPQQSLAARIPSPLELLLFSPCPRAVAVLASYPRSGNSLLRTLYERTTLRVTGSDMRGGLTKHDLVGEAATQNNAVQFVKTHFPERRGTPPFLVNRAVLLVRNPYDAIESYFNLMMTDTHTTSLTEEQRKQNAEEFAQMALKEIQVWRDFHEFWLAQQIPLLVIRYEDLIRHTDKVMEKVIRFVLEVNHMGFFEDRLDKCIREEQIEKLGSYQPRSGGIGKSFKMYTPELLAQMNHGIADTMVKFGYDEMMVPNPQQHEFQLKPLDQFGVEIEGKPNTVMSINGNRIVRGPKRHTNWLEVRKRTNMIDQKCTCSKCSRGR